MLSLHLRVAGGDLPVILDGVHVDAAQSADRGFSRIDLLLHLGRAELFLAPVLLCALLREIVLAEDVAHSCGQPVGDLLHLCADTEQVLVQSVSPLRDLIPLFEIFLLLLCPGRAFAACLLQLLVQAGKFFLQCFDPCLILPDGRFLLADPALGILGTAFQSLPLLGEFFQFLLQAAYVLRDEAVPLEGRTVGELRFLLGACQVFPAPAFLLKLYVL